MQIINQIDEHGRFSGFKANCSYEHQGDSHFVSYLYARNHYYHEHSDEDIGLADMTNSTNLHNQRLEEILGKYNLLECVK